jgi:hypothetical protein
MHSILAFASDARRLSLESFNGFRFQEGSIAMDLKKILAQLREERETLDVVISSLERVEHGRRRGPGRPPNWVTKSATNGANPAHRPPTPAPGEE